MSGARRNWVAAACAEHVRRGRELGIMQVCHGKGGPLRRIHAGDGVAYYSPAMVFGGGERCQAFTALGTVSDDRIYQVEMHPGFAPFRRDVDWYDAAETPISPLLDRLDFTRVKKNWGYAFRFELMEVSERDLKVITRAMKAKLATLERHPM
jgi:hypothetical protein